MKGMQRVTFTPSYLSLTNLIIDKRQQKIDFLLWCVQRGDQLTSVSLSGFDCFSCLPFGREPFDGVKMAVETLRAYEDLAAGTYFIYGATVYRG